MGYVKPRLTEDDLDLMSQFLDRSRGRVLTSDEWGDQPIPQGVSVFLFNEHSYEYMFTKDEKYTGRVDYRRPMDEFDYKAELWAPLYSYIPKDYVMPVYYMNKDAVAIISNHRFRGRM